MEQMGPLNYKIRGRGKVQIVNVRRLIKYDPFLLEDESVEEALKRMKEDFKEVPPISKEDTLEEENAYRAPVSEKEETEKESKEDSNRKSAAGIQSKAPIVRGVPMSDHSDIGLTSCGTVKSRYHHSATQTIFQGMPSTFESEETHEEHGPAPAVVTGGEVERPDDRSDPPASRNGGDHSNEHIRSKISKHHDLPHLVTYDQAPVARSKSLSSPGSSESAWRGQPVIIKSGSNNRAAGIISSWVGDQCLVQLSDNSEALADLQDLELLSSRPSVPNSSSSPLPVRKVLQNPKPRRRSGPKLKLVGKFVKIVSGRHLGELGFVTRGANGYYSVAFSADSSISHEVVMKRAGDLKEIERPEGFVDGPNNKLAMDMFKEGEPPKKRKRSRPMSGKDSWIAQKVVVREGKYRGEVGLVKRSGHGFYCVDFPQHGEVMKRGIDLELYNADCSPYHSQSHTFNIDQLQLSPATKKTYKKMKMSTEKMGKTVSSSRSDVELFSYDTEEIQEDKQEEHELAASILVEMLQRGDSESERSDEGSEHSDSSSEAAGYLEDFDSFYVPARQLTR
eukprot:g38788.t1